MKYTQFTSLPVKGRIKWVKEKLFKLGYLDESDCESCSRDKKYVKALMKFQKYHEMVPNADVTSELFEKLNYN